MTGEAATDLIVASVEINAEIALEEPEMEQGIDEELYGLLDKYGLKAVLASIHDAAWAAAEVHADMEDDLFALASVRLKSFSRRLHEAMNALK
jgi:hypothetical protein